MAPGAARRHMELDEIMIAAGIGCRRHTAAEAISDLVTAIMAEAGLDHIDRLAAPHFKAFEPGIVEAAAHLGCELVWVDEASLSAWQHLCPTGSVHAFAHRGHASISEACALAGTDSRSPSLLFPRRTRGRVACAIATGDSSS